MKYKRSIFIFRRDLRLDDNIGLLKALEESELVLPIFILSNKQLVNNEYKSNNLIQFMIESLEDLNHQLRHSGSKLYYFNGHAHSIIASLISMLSIECVYVNTDYSPYSVNRDKRIQKACIDHDCNFLSCEDSLLTSIGSARSMNRNRLMKFGQYYTLVKNIPVHRPSCNRYTNYYTKDIAIEYKSCIHSYYRKNHNIALHGGRSQSLALLDNIQEFRNYNNNENSIIHNTTQLSAYIRFGCVSIREVYYTFKHNLTHNNNLIKKLYWRDYYFNIAFFNPHIYDNVALNQKYDSISWNDNVVWYYRWKNGETGFPLVDACMRELNTTGFMHIRGRILVANFLVKILRIDWKDGQKHFVQRLIDYDQCINSGCWQWAAGTGAEVQPHDVILNPANQIRKYDKNASYIRNWIPEFKHIPIDHIIRWDKYHTNYNIDYPPPMLDYDKERNISADLYKSIFA